MYQTYDVYWIRPDGERQHIGSVSAQSAEQAIYRLAGGDFGRTDYEAEER